MEVGKSKLDEQAKKFLSLAKKYGIEKNFLFATTFERYLMQIKILSALKNSIDKAMEDEEMSDAGVFVTKEYVKGRKNIYTHPAISEYNKTTDSSNKTAGVLINIISKMKGPEKKDKSDIDKFIDGFKRKRKSRNKKAEYSDDLS